MTDTTTEVAATFDEPESPPLSRLVIDAVADAEGVDATGLDALYDAIDPDALDALFRDEPRRLDAGDAAADPADATPEVVFAYHGYEVRATAAGHVRLADL